MRFGICCGIDEAGPALDAGFDYVELPANALLANFSRFEDIRPEATNQFFPPDMKLMGDGATPHLEYVLETVEAASRVGVETMVVGSGAARRAPDGVSQQDAESRFCRICYELYEVADPLGITIAPESLNRTETNVGNRLNRLAAQLHDLGVGYTADSYHVISEWIFEGNEAPPNRGYWIEQVPYLPSHVHLASRDRFDPMVGDPDLEGFVHRLYELGYSGRVSLECRRRSNQDLKKALADARALFGK